jgi:hypothetical protein
MPDEGGHFFSALVHVSVHASSLRLVQQGLVILAVPALVAAPDGPAFVCGAGVRAPRVHSPDGVAVHHPPLLTFIAARPLRLGPLHTRPVASVISYQPADIRLA